MTNSTKVERARLRARRVLLAVSTVLCSGLAAPAFAQVAAPSPVRNNIDGNGVDLFLGTMNVDGPTLSVGDGQQQGMTWRKLLRGNGGWGDTLVGTLTVSGTTVYVSFGETTDRFTQSGTSYIPTEGNGASLTHSGTTYTYTANDGTVVTFTSVYVGFYPYGNVQGIVSSVKKPNNVVFTYAYDSTSYCSKVKTVGDNDVCVQHLTAYRIASVTSNAPYKLSFIYAGWNPANIDPNVAYSAGDALPGWGNITSVSLKNTAITGAVARTQSFSVASGTGNDSYFKITDAMSRMTAYRSTYLSSLGKIVLTGITRPGSANEDLTLTYDSSGRVYTLADASGTTTYTYSDSGGSRTTTVTDPLGHVSTFVFDISQQRPISATDATGRMITKQYDTSGRVTHETAPEGNYTQYTYDSRGNVTETRKVAKPGSGLADLVVTADYDPSCTAVAKCNSPNWTKDAKGNQTNYTYNAVTGDVLNVTAPAASSSAARPTANYSYTTVNGISMVSGISTCSIAAACVGTATETKVSIGYNASGLATTKTVQAGDGSVASTTTTTYDDVGNVTSVDGPLAGNADTITYRYDADRELVGVVGADPGSAHKRQATRSTYDLKGRVTLAEVGTVTDASDAAWGAFSSQQQVVTTYDGVDRALTQSLTAVGTTYSSTQYVYDHHRLDQITLLMNGVGPDRVTKYAYDDADRQIKVTFGYGTADQSDGITVVYTSNGQQASVTDANGNITSYGYDGFDRLSTTTYAGGSYEQLSYDDDGNVTSQRLRDGSIINYGYDALNRLITKDRPNSAYWETDQAYGYDLTGHLTSATDSNGRSLGFNYDALGRQTANSDNWYTYGNASSQYDAAGHRTRYGWADGLFVTYSYNAAGNVTSINDNSGAALITYGYDDLGRRTSLNRANGTSTNYSYDPASRLTGLTLAGGNQPNSITLNYNSANQITSRTSSNDAYTWTGAVNTDRGYAVNGLNQYTTAGGSTFGYDVRGNLTSSDGTSYTYTSDNQLATAPGVSLAYDPLGRLFNGGFDAGVNTTLVYDGANVTSELDQSNPSGLLRRYVYGPGDDEPLVWYEGAGTDNRRFLGADERGSIVEVTDNAGNAIAVNRYDEYGIPQSTNLGRFQYTGQKWLPTLGVYDYKARIYSPTLGRFLQTDPIGYGDGLNWYNYTGSDPVNGTDPTGSFMDYPDIGGGGSWGWSCFGNCAVSGYWNSPMDPLDGFQWDRAGKDTATPKEALDYITKHGGYTQINADGSEQWVKVDLNSQLSSVLNKLIEEIGGGAERATDDTGVEFSYSIFQKLDSNRLKTIVNHGKPGEGVVTPTLKLKGYKLILAGHTHNLMIGGVGFSLFGIQFGPRQAVPGPSPMDMGVESRHPGVIFILHQKWYGRGWETVRF